MSSWEKVGKYSGGGSDFIKLKNGEKIRVHILSSEPRVVFQVYDHVGRKNANIPEGFKLPDGVSLRVQHAFVVYNMTAAKVQVLAMSDTTCEKLKEVYESYGGSLDKVDIDYKRRGENLETEYDCVPVPTAFDKSVVEGVDMPDLDRIYKPSNDETIEATIQAILASSSVKEKLAKKEAKAAKKEAAPAPAPATPAADEMELTMQPTEPAKPTTTRVGVRKDVRTDADKACPTCKAVREVREGTVKTNDPETGLPWGKVKALVCKPCNKLDVVEKLPDPVAVPA